MNCSCGGYLEYFDTKHGEETWKCRSCGCVEVFYNDVGSGC